MLDVHIIVRPDAQPDWLAECERRTRTAIDNAGFPVCLHWAPYIAGHIGQARATGYSLGFFPYVTYVDDDDYIASNAFSAMAEAIKQRPDAIFMMEQQLQNGWMSPGLQRHHLCVYKREHLIDHSQWVVCGDLAQMRAVSGKHCIDIPEPVYVHRLYQSGGRALRRQHHDELRMARG